MMLFDLGLRTLCKIYLVSIRKAPDLIGGVNLFEEQKGS